MKILVIMTGGTISSYEKDGFLVPSDDIGDILEAEYRKTGDEQTAFNFISPFTILSENLCADNINRIIETTEENINGYDGIIITHGTDTLQYTAAALGFYFANIKKPILLVSAQYPLGDKRTNGFENFISATEFIKKQIGGVYVAYKNDRDKEVKVHIATRLFSHNESLGAIESMAFDEKINRGENVRFKLSENSEVLAVSMIPGDSFSYSLDNVASVILRPYHSGTLNMKSKKLKEFLNKAKMKDIPIFLTNAREGIGYESTKEFENLPIEVLPPSAFPAIYMKCWIAKSMGWNIKDFVKKRIWYEF
ncbi:MAG: asparaginase domain-containing protein [Clostridia bacterium]|nr:asparaginase domain-containing protein [Clostridia bacterium]